MRQTEQDNQQLQAKQATVLSENKDLQDKLREVSSKLQQTAQTETTLRQEKERITAQHMQLLKEFEDLHQKKQLIDQECAVLL